ncbi:MAG TPA: GlsB/YeaQ/YmgE family stress response membrane protein [Thermoguttaceae bacterium]|nr:GlsB/YeaQ/YmgE family stress response membrane protein [Thermoguttaceae bacterium]HPP53507.1 GlsB/YeaQ/YmgE family stress response membrane protein [Thermoguttaceae bacterium]
MEEWNLAPAAQQWVNIALIWVGFAMLAGLLARTLVPSSPSVGPVATLVIGMLGSVVGLFGLSYFLQGKPINPISPMGLFAASAGALVLLVLYRLAGAGGPESASQDSAKSGSTS